MSNSIGIRHSLAASAALEHIFMLQGFEDLGMDVSVTLCVSLPPGSF